LRRLGEISRQVGGGFTENRAFHDLARVLQSLGQQPCTPERTQVMKAIAFFSAALFSLSLITATVIVPLGTAQIVA
jgi:hypothetical protein